MSEAVKIAPASVDVIIERFPDLTLELDTQYGNYLVTDVIGRPWVIVTSNAFNSIYKFAAVERSDELSEVVRIERSITDEYRGDAING